MVMTRKELEVNQVLYGEGKAEMISAKIRTNGREMTIIVEYVPPKHG